MSIVLRFFPNGEFSQGVDTSTKRRSRLEYLSSRLVDKPSPVVASHVCAEMNAEILDETSLRGNQYISAMGSIWTYICADMNGYHYAVENEYGETWELKSEHSPLRLVGLGELRPVPLGSSDARILTKSETSRKSCLSMTKSMARNIRNACYILEKKYGKDRISFLTLTVPDLDSEGLAKVCENWDKLVHRFLKWLRTKVEKIGIDFEYVYCTEIQTKRLERRGEYAPHLHLVFRGKRVKKSNWAVTPKQCRKEWVRCLKSCTDSPFQSCALENLQVVKRSVSGYLSKYMSKGSNTVPEDSDRSPIIRLRTQWGGMSRELSRSIRKASTVITGELRNGLSASNILRSIPRGLETGVVKYFRTGQIPLKMSSDDLSTKYLSVGVGCLALPLWEGGLIPLLELSMQFTESLVC